MIMWIFPATNVLEYGYASMEPLFTIGPYFFMFLIPAVTIAQSERISEPCMTQEAGRDSTAGGAIARPARFGKGDK